MAMLGMGGKGCDHILFLPERYVDVDLLPLLRIRCLTSNHSAFLSSVLSFPPCEHKQID